MKDCTELRGSGVGELLLWMCLCSREPPPPKWRLLELWSLHVCRTPVGFGSGSMSRPQSDFRCDTLGRLVVTKRGNTLESVYFSCDLILLDSITKQQRSDEWRYRPAVTSRTFIYLNVCRLCQHYGLGKESLLRITFWHPVPGTGILSTKIKPCKLQYKHRHMKEAQVLARD